MSTTPEDLAKTGIPLGRARMEAEAHERQEREMLEGGADRHGLPDDVAEALGEPDIDHQLDATLSEAALIPVLTNPQVALLASAIGNAGRGARIRAIEVQDWAEAALEWLDAKDAERDGGNS